ncbi:MAG: hypothetical protein CVT59_00030 [Actinobacteria bacterium HGW-Actinobacteria-1]|jgi:hypothetical protein|nr:MAG: hypothetical protein CVT59_00030 [Actinobacteria bacterium HGW-Actinobacteria-1]
MLVTTWILVSCTTGVAFAYDESTSTIPAMTEDNCGRCHNPYGYSIFHGTTAIGVHGGYTTTTYKCKGCHTIHDAPSDGVLLLPAATVQASCESCHDGTGGGGVYGTIAARGLTVASGHSVETTSVIPGGSAATGGSASMTFGGLNGTLTCTDCHSPHGSDLVAAYQGDRYRLAGSTTRLPQIKTHLLKQHPGNSPTGTADYGSDWCLACHQGRSSAQTVVHNHPVDSAATTTTPFVYSRVAVLNASGAWTGTTVANQTLGFSNQGYLMPYPRTAQQAGHAPICQQCHEDARSVGSLSTTGTQALVTPFLVTMPDGVETSSNPRFQNFPHESTNYRMLVEAGATQQLDDLCLNCHPTSQLP